MFDVLVTTVKQPEFRGCAFANASAESEPDSAAAEVTRKVRAWLLGVMAEQATALGAADPAGLARQLTLLYDGALVQSRAWPCRRHCGEGGRPSTHRCGLSGRAEPAVATNPRGAQHRKRILLDRHANFVSQVNNILTILMLSRLDPHTVA